MDKDRIEGSEKGSIGKVKEVAGKVLGDAKLQSDGKYLYDLTYPQPSWRRLSYTINFSSVDGSTELF